jgi:hypothetical protein
MNLAASIAVILQYSQPYELRTDEDLRVNEGCNIIACMVTGLALVRYPLCG